MAAYAACRFDAVFSCEATVCWNEMEICKLPVVRRVNVHGREIPEGNSKSPLREFRDSIYSPPRLSLSLSLSLSRACARDVKDRGDSSSPSWR